MSNNCVVLSNCNEWKEHDSSRIVGIYTDMNTLGEKVWSMFLNGEVEWDGRDIDSLSDEAREEYRDCINNPEDYGDDFNIESSIKESFDILKGEVYDEIMGSDVDDIHSRAKYIMLQSFELNVG